jgi:high-affinity nickel-transport protein
VTTASTRRGPRLNPVHLAGLFSVIALMHVVAFGLLLAVVVPANLSAGGQVFGIGLGLTAYTLGLRHAFDADHIAAIDNTTRKFMAEGRRPVTVGFWFALGHSSVVFVLAVLVVAGTRAAGTLTAKDSSVHQILGIAGTSVSGLFLYLIGLLNLVALIGIVRVFRRLRSGEFDEAALEKHLDNRGVLNRVLGGLTRSIRRPGQMFPIGLLFGVGFDTASEATLLILAGTGAAAGLPWYAVVVLPLLFASGMTLLDTLDGTFMTYAYDWAFANPVRKVYYNIAITGLSVAVALIIGTIELVTVLHNDIGFNDPVTRWISGMDLNNVGFLVVGVFIVVWVAAVAYWRFGGVEQRWTSGQAGHRGSGEPSEEPDRGAPRITAVPTPEQ